MANINASPAPRTKRGAPAKPKIVTNTKLATNDRNTRAPKPKTPARQLVSQAPSAPKGTTKLQILVALLERPQGARIDELMAATSWQAHSVRGALAGALKKQGIAVTSVKIEGCRCYSIAKLGRG